MPKFVFLVTDIALALLLAGLALYVWHASRSPDLRRPGGRCFATRRR
jgi:peptide/nickel transport system permease protein